MRAKLLKAATVLALLAILLGMPLLLTSHRIRPSAFVCIQNGMTDAEVEDLLGAPPGDYDGYVSQLRLAVIWKFEEEPPSKKWCSRHGAVRVWFRDGRVCYVYSGPTEPHSCFACLIDTLLTQLGGQDRQRL